MTQPVQYGRYSFYTKTPQVNNYVNYLDFWNGSYILPAASDTLITLDQTYQHRPDLLSYQLYGTVQLFWVFMLRNPDKIRDPIWDFVQGLDLYVPARDRLTGSY